MRSRREGRHGTSILAAAIVLISSATAAWAQPGFGPDPFWPYNDQYTPYTRPVGPATPEGGQGGGLNARDGLRGANQFQDYLESLQGPGRNNSDRSSVGMPYYRAAVNPTYESRERGPRQYQPNSRAGLTHEDAQRRAADVYFRYYAERDPGRRGELLKQYREARRESSVALSRRGSTAARARNAATGPDTDPRGEAGATPPAPRPGSAGGARSATGRFGPAPEVPTLTPRRSSAPRPRRESPTDILNRSRAMDREGLGGASAGRGATGPSVRPRSRGPARPSPSPLPPEDGRS